MNLCLQGDAERQALTWNRKEVKTKKTNWEAAHSQSAGVVCQQNTGVTFLKNSEMWEVELDDYREEVSFQDEWFQTS